MLDPGIDKYIRAKRIERMSRFAFGAIVVTALITLISIGIYYALV